MIRNQHGKIFCYPVYDISNNEYFDYTKSRKKEISDNKENYIFSKNMRNLIKEEIRNNPQYIRELNGESYLYYVMFNIYNVIVNKKPFMEIREEEDEIIMSIVEENIPDIMDSLYDKEDYYSNIHVFFNFINKFKNIFFEHCKFRGWDELLFFIHGQNILGEIENGETPIDFDMIAKHNLECCISPAIYYTFKSIHHFWLGRPYVSYSVEGDVFRKFINKGFKEYSSNFVKKLTENVVDFFVGFANYFKNKMKNLEKWNTRETKEYYKFLSLNCIMAEYFSFLDMNIFEVFEIIDIIIKLENSCFITVSKDSDYILKIENNVDIYSQIINIIRKEQINLKFTGFSDIENNFKYSYDGEINSFGEKVSMLKKEHDINLNKTLINTVLNENWYNSDDMKFNI